MVAPRPRRGLEETKMKKTAIRLMAPAVFALLALGAVACGGGDAETTHEPEPEPAPAEAAPAEAASAAAAPAAAPAAAAADAGNTDGAEAYATYCVSCHGVTGAGDGPVGAALDPKPASFADAAFWTDERTDEHLAKAIKEGGPAVGKSPLMAPWGAVLDDAKVKAVVAHIKSLKAG
jgi:mono/diheme cytochrome c family protein